MCGIAGFWDFKRRTKEETLSSMTDALSHRGPDDRGIYLNPEEGLGLGHRRLSVIDLSSAGRQPMSNGPGRLWITYNGEVYNYREIREELSKKGHTFRTKTDTEVTLKAYEEWGLEAVHRLRGMFAFAVWDAMERKLVLVRDRLGVKPLYYYFKDGLFAFASEVKSLLTHPLVEASLSMEALRLYLKYGYVPAPFSIFEGIHKLGSASFLEITGDMKSKEQTYWNVFDFYSRRHEAPEEKVEEELEELIKEAFQYRLVSDVPVGVFLSGGIDSSLVASVLNSLSNRRLRTFTVGFMEKDWDESLWARDIAAYLGTEHTELTLTEKDALGIIPTLPLIYDEPFSDSSAIPTYLISRATKGGVKVALSGEGGDELFCGYTTYTKFGKLYGGISGLPRFLRTSLYKVLGSLPEALCSKVLCRFSTKSEGLSDKISKVRALLKSNEVRDAYGRFISLWDDLEIAGLTGGGAYPRDISMNGRIPDSDILTFMMAFDSKILLPDNMLVKIDRASMAVGLEVREPLLDHKLVEYAASLPLGYKYSKGMTKHILRKILYKHLPQGLVDRPKRGFSVPLGKWLRCDLRQLLLDYLAPSRIKTGGIFNPLYVSNTVEIFLKGQTINPKKPWSLLAFELWREKWLKK